MKKYVGITIGPIGETISDATSPAALWFASTFFSDISRRLCVGVKQELEECILYSPYLDPLEEEELIDGIGKYNDRIIFSAVDTRLEEKLRKIIDDVKCDVINDFDKSMYLEEKRNQAVSFLKDYIFIEYIIMNEEDMGNTNCILKMSPYLDSIELMRYSNSSSRENPIRTTFLGIDNNKNKYVKDSELVRNCIKNNEENKKILFDEKSNIRSIESIAGVNGNVKHRYYYAVVSADGDNMTKFFEALGTDATKITSFSQYCFEYNKKSAQAIVDFGGMPIYAGGDDLLFIAPIIHNGESVISFCNRLAKDFAKTLSDKFTDAIPSISFGISIQYYKYPLYEALSASRELLAVSKNSKGKNCITVNIQKHSGQSIKLVAGNEAIDELEKFIMLPVNKYSKYGKDSVNVSNFINSVGNKLLQFKTIIHEIDKLYDVNNEVTQQNMPWSNLFDNDGQKGATEYLVAIQRLYYGYLIKKSARIKGMDSDDKIMALVAALKLGRFLIEGKEAS